MDSTSEVRLGFAVADEIRRRRGGLERVACPVGELTLQNDFLSGALNKAGLLSARR
jgi:hypothetical protein